MTEHYTLRIDKREIGEDLAVQQGELSHESSTEDLIDTMIDSFESWMGNGTKPLRDMLNHVIADLRQGIDVGHKISTVFARPSRPYIWFVVERHADIPEVAEQSVSC